MAFRYCSDGVIRFGLTALIFALACTARAADIEQAAAIKSAVEAAVMPRLAAMKNADFDVAVGTIDTRLRLPECAAPDVTLPAVMAAAISVKVSCAEPQWVIYVPAHIHAWVEAVVAATNLAPNSPLSPRDLMRARVDAFAATGGLLTDPREARGKILRTGVVMGAPISSPMLELPVAVRRGQKVMLTLSDATMTIKATALALEDGRVGDNIAVENPESRKTIHATVDRDGGVELKF